MTESPSLMSMLKNGLAIGIWSLLGTASSGGSMAFLIYAHLVSLSSHQMVVL